MAGNHRRRTPWAPRLLAVGSVLLVLFGCGAGADQGATVAGAGASTSGPSAGLSPAAGPRTETSMLVFGDSYAAGVGADSASTSFAHETGTDLGWATTVDAVSGTGYLNPGPTPGLEQTYADRLAGLSAKALDVDVIVVEGGLNDRLYPGQDVTAAATAFLQTLRARAPQATIVVVGAPDPVPAQAASSVAVNAEIATAATATGVGFVDPVAEGWITDANAGLFISADQLHPDQAGHDHIAALLAADLEVIVGTS